MCARRSAAPQFLALMHQAPDHLEHQLMKVGVLVQHVRQLFGRIIQQHDRGAPVMRWCSASVAKAAPDRRRSSVAVFVVCSAISSSRRGVMPALMRRACSE